MNSQMKEGKKYSKILNLNEHNRSERPDQDKSGLRFTNTKGKKKEEFFLSLPFERP